MRAWGEEDMYKGKNACLGACVPRGCVYQGVCVPGGIHAQGRGVHAQEQGNACPGAEGVRANHAPFPVDRILDTRLWKHYLPATTVAGDKYVSFIICSFKSETDSV